MTSDNKNGRTAEDYIIRGLSYWDRTAHIKEKYLNPDQPDFKKYVDTEAILYIKDIQDAGVPLPHWHDMLNVGGETDLRLFLSIGYECYQRVRSHMEPGEKRRRVLDFGVGCGRTARHFYRETNHFDIYGCDVDSSSIEYLQKEVNFIHAFRSSNAPPLPYDDNFFDFIYSISVFTHLREQSFKDWAVELCRVLRPGGRALLTMHGTLALRKIQENKKLSEMDVDEDAFRERIRDWGRTGFLWVPQRVVSSDVDANQYGIAFSDEQRLQEFIPPSLQLISYIPGDIGGWQDMAIFQRV